MSLFLMIWLIITLCLFVISTLVGVTTLKTNTGGPIWSALGFCLSFAGLGLLFSFAAKNKADVGVTIVLSVCFSTAFLLLFVFVFSCLPYWRQRKQALKGIL